MTKINTVCNMGNMNASINASQLLSSPSRHLLPLAYPSLHLPRVWEITTSGPLKTWPSMVNYISGPLPRALQLSFLIENKIKQCIMQKSKLGSP